jgi:hypothetical protein
MGHWIQAERCAREFTRPTNSSMIFGLLPAAVMRLGLSMSVGISEEMSNIETRMSKQIRI